jgi:hypothetical protein
LLAGDENELHSTVNEIVKKINFSTTSITSRDIITLRFATGRSNTGYKYIQTDSSSITTILTLLTTFEFVANFTINVEDQVFVCFNLGSGSLKLFVTGMDTKTDYSSSYYWSVLTRYSNVQRST